MFQLVDKTKVPDARTDESWLGRVVVAAFCALVDVDITLRGLLGRIKDGEEDVLRLEITMDDVLVVQILDSFENSK